jgi:hypothetical protein
MDCLLQFQAGNAGEAVLATMEEVLALLTEGKQLGLQLKGLPKLIAVMAQAKAWTARANRAFTESAKGARLSLTASLSSTVLHCHQRHH